MGANWFNRSEAEIRSVLAQENILTVHISATERDAYEDKNIAQNNVWLPYFPPDEFQIEKISIKQKFEFGFIGTQNSVNAHGLMSLYEICQKIEGAPRLLISGSITNGISDLS